MVIVCRGERSYGEGVKDSERGSGRGKTGWG